jgi:hypothetical protein
MSSQQQLHFTRQPHARARAVAQVQEQNQHKITMMVAFALASAIIALWMAYLPTLTGSIPTNLNILPQYLPSASDSVNRANKDSQLTSVRFDDRWNALAAMTIQTLGENGVHARATDPAKDTQRIPVGCEPAFSPLVKAGNFIARCLS